jgi:hypothetical protein
MEEGRTTPFRGIVDMTSEMNRMRQLGMYGYDPWQEYRERTHANAWVPAADVFAKGEDLMIRLAGVGFPISIVSVMAPPGTVYRLPSRPSSLTQGPERSLAPPWHLRLAGGVDQRAHLFGLSELVIE